MFFIKKLKIKKTEFLPLKRNPEDFILIFYNSKLLCAFNINSFIEIAKEDKEEKGYRFTKPTTLYYVKIVKHNKIYYKIGITSVEIKNRMSSAKVKSSEFKVLWSQTFPTGIEAYFWEQVILAGNKEHKNKLNKDIFKRKHILKNGYGDGELFLKDILGLDKDHYSFQREMEF